MPAELRRGPGEPVVLGSRTAAPAEDPLRGAGVPSAPCPASSAKPSMGGRRSRDIGRGAIWCSKSAMRASLQGKVTSQSRLCHRLADKL